MHRKECEKYSELVRKKKRLLTSIIQVELLLPIIRATYCAEMARLSRAKDLPPKLPCPLDFQSSGGLLPLPKGDPLTRGMTTATQTLVNIPYEYRRLLKEKNLSGVVTFQGQDKQEEILVRTEVLTHLWRILNREKDVPCQDKIQLALVNSVRRVVQGVSAQLGLRYNSYLVTKLLLFLYLLPVCLCLSWVE